MTFGQFESDPSPSLAGLDANFGKLRASAETGLLDAGAAGDGATDDTAVLTAIAAASRWGVRGNWRTYAVTDTSNANRVQDAVFVKSGVAELPPVTAAQFGGSVTVNRFGGQLGQLLRRLADPLCQSVNITISADSIGWGVGATGQAASGTRDGTLSDPRNNYASGSWANLFKRWVGSFLGTGASVALSNHPAAASGESIATWTKSVAVYPNGLRFTKSTTGSVSDTEVQDSATLCNRRRLLSVNPSAKIVLTFTFTGDTIEVVFGCIANGASYNLYVNGVAVASAQPTRAGVSGLTAGYSRSWTHTFTRVVDAVVEFEVVHHDNVSGVDALYIEAFRFPKRVRVSNQGIIGATSLSVLTYHMPTSREAGVGLRPIAQITGVTETASGTTSKAERPAPGSSTGVQTLYGLSTGASWDIVVPVGSTKDKLEIRYSATAGGCDVEVRVGGSVIDTFSTNSNAPGVSFGYAKQRIVTLPGGTTSVTIRTVYANYGGGAAYTNYLYLEGVASYTASDITYPTNNGFGDGLAFSTDDDFGVIAIGTNDRIKVSSGAAINSPHALSTNVESILNLTPTKLLPIIITPAPALVDGPPTMHMSAREAGNALRELGQRKAVDVINLQSLFAGQAYDMWAPDGLHPGDIGHKVYADAVINAIESSP